MVKGFIIHSRPFKESASLLWILNEHNEVHTLFFYPTSKNNHPPSPFALIAYQTSSDNTQSLAQYEKLDHKIPRPHTLNAGMHINFLVNKTIPKLSPHPSLFNTYSKTIDLCNRSSPQSSSLIPILIAFEYFILCLTGYGIDFQYDQFGRAIQPNKYYTFSPTSGFAPSINKNGYLGQYLQNICTHNIPCESHCVPILSTITTQIFQQHFHFDITLSRKIIHYL